MMNSRIFFSYRFFFFCFNLLSIDYTHVRLNATHFIIQSDFAVIFKAQRTKATLDNEILIDIKNRANQN